MLRSLVRLLAGAVAMAGLAFPTLAADRAIIILDASGSMWAQIDGKARIDIARDTLKQVLAGVPSDLELGFMAYGHRSKGDCNDIQTLVEPAPGTADAISKAAAGLNPKGKTPLSASVKMAADELKYTEDKATVILITDGIETCDADPCALATALAKDGVDFKVDVVGLALSKEEGEQVRCLADNTKGKYISADDADGLQHALTDVVADVTQPASSEEAPPPSSEEPGINFKPTMVLDESGTAVPDDANVAWEFYKKKADGSQGEYVSTLYGANATGTIDPGDYLVNAKLDFAHIEMPVTIAASGVASPQFDMEAGFIHLRPLPSAGADVDDHAAIDEAFPNRDTFTAYGEQKAFVPAGETKLAVTIGAAKLDDSVTVAAGQSVDKDIVVGSGHVTATASYSPGQAVDDGSLFIDVFEAKKDIQGNRKEVANGYGPTVEFDLLPGDYVAVGTYDAAKVEFPFSVKSGEAQSFDIPLNAGVLAVTAPNGYYTEVFAAKKDIQGNRLSFGGSYDMAASRTLPAGDYHIVVTLQNDAGTKETDVTIKAGERSEITVQ